ncbi:MAG: cytochrome C [Chlorobiaceae bacterium]|nr:cytochrome C [Chlorobiaceae bacterium]NTV16714.1 cytochrome C [Chlorobiaceae bacterium]
MLITSTLTGVACAVEKPSLEKGKLLFNSLSLAGAVTGKSCASCHPNGAGLQKAWMNPNLAVQVNTCIAGPLGGSKLDVNSVDMQSLILYIRSLKQ